MYMNEGFFFTTLYLHAGQNYFWAPNFTMMMKIFELFKDHGLIGRVPTEESLEPVARKMDKMLRRAQGFSIVMSRPEKAGGGSGGGGGSVNPRFAELCSLSPELPRMLSWKPGKTPEFITSGWGTLYVYVLDVDQGNEATEAHDLAQSIHKEFQTEHKGLVEDFKTLTNRNLESLIDIGYVFGSEERYNEQRSAGWLYPE